MNESDKVLISVQEQKKTLQIQKSDFECKLSNVESLLVKEEELWRAVEEYSQHKLAQFSAFLAELEDLEFKIEEEIIKSGDSENNMEENQPDQQTSNFQIDLEILMKKYMFKKCFYWE